jgi:hypothetical protein
MEFGIFFLPQKKRKKTFVYVLTLTKVNIRLKLDFFSPVFIIQTNISQNHRNHFLNSR